MTATATIPQLGFIHEDSGQSFVLDIADLYRDAVTVPEAFRAVSIHTKQPAENMERLVRRMTGEAIRKQQLVAKMIDKIKALFEPEASTDSSHAPATIVQNRLTEGDSDSHGGTD